MIFRAKWVGLLLFLSSQLCFALGDIGFNSHIGQGRDSVANVIENIETLGVRSVRDEIYWANVEAQRGILRVTPRLLDLRLVAKRLKDAGGYLVLTLGYGNAYYDGKVHPRSYEARRAFSRYARFVATELSGLGVRYQIWNEWNSEIGVPSGSGPGGVVDYVALLKDVSPEIKSADPTGKVLSTGLARGVESVDWLRKFVDAGGGKYVDGFGIHLYIYNKPGWTVSRLSSLLQDLSVEQGRFGDEMREKGVYVTEMGFPVGTGNAESVSGAKLLQSILILSANPLVRGVWVYQLKDSTEVPEGNSEHGFGLIDSGGVPRGVFDGFRFVARESRTCSRAQRNMRTGGEVVGVRLEGCEDGRPLAFAWGEGRRKWAKANADCYVLRPYVGKISCATGFQGATEELAIEVVRE